MAKIRWIQSSLSLIVDVVVLFVAIFLCNFLKFFLTSCNYALDNVIWGKLDAAERTSVSNELIPRKHKNVVKR